MIRGIVAKPNATIQEQRASFEASMGMMPVPPNTKVTPLKADGIAAEWVDAPGARTDHAILYLHGGGYVIGSPVTHRSLAAKLSETSKARVLVIDYRMAPEAPFPAAVEDAVKAYRWLLAQGLSACEAGHFRRQRGRRVDACNLGGSARRRCGAAKGGGDA